MLDIKSNLLYLLNFYKLYTVHCVLFTLHCFACFSSIVCGLHLISSAGSVSDSISVVNAIATDPIFEPPDGIIYNETPTVQAMESLYVTMLMVGVVATLVYTAVVSFVILKLVDMIVGLRVSDEEETQGLDLVLHDERGYDL